MREFIVRPLGRVPYEPTWRAMQEFTAQRTPDTPDELWVVEHDPVYTLGQAGKPEHLLIPSEIPVVKIDRGGQITYHGPGQVVIYILMDLHRAGIRVKEFVHRIEQAVIDCVADCGLAAQGLVAERKDSAPGVYVNGDKIGALGLRIKNGASYHGVSLNVNMNLMPFHWINPCGYAGLKTIQLADFGITLDTAEVATRLTRLLQQHLDTANKSDKAAAHPADAAT